MAMSRAIALAFVLGLAGIAPAWAHDIWLTLTSGAPARVAVNYGHPHDRPPPEAEKIVELNRVTAQGTASLLGELTAATERGAPVVETAPVETDAAVLAARYDNGYWVKMPDGEYRNTSKRVVPGAPNSSWSMKFAKAVVGAGGPWSRVLGHELELVPLADPAAAVRGGVVQVQVLFRGQPLPGVDVERGDGVTPVEDIPRFRTDDRGIAAIPIAEDGLNLLAIDYLVKPSGTPDLAAGDLYNATLAFEVGERR